MLTGTLDDFTLADVLRLVAGASRTGSLAVTRGEGAGDLYFRDGVVSRAVPRYERRAAASSPSRAVEELTFDLMRWGRGEFRWTPDAPTPHGPEAGVEVDELLREVSRRLDELAQIQALVPSEDAVLTMAPQPPEGAVQINITPAEWRVLVLVDGHRSVGEVAAAAGLDDLDAMRLLYGLASSGLVSAGADEAVPPQGVPDVTGMPGMAAQSDVLPEEAYAPEAPLPPALEAPEPDPQPVVEEQAPEPDALAEREADLVADERAPEPDAYPDAFLAELDIEPLSHFDPAPAAAAEAPEAPEVDRSTAARELAGLFDDFEAPAGMQRMVAPAPPPPGERIPRRVEDDDQVTRGLISRLIDGVKGL